MNLDEPLYRANAQIAFNSSALKSDLARPNFNPSKKTMLIDFLGGGICIVVAQTVQYDMCNANDVLSCMLTEKYVRTRKLCETLVLSI